MDSDHRLLKNVNEKGSINLSDVKIQVIEMVADVLGLDSTELDPLSSSQDIEGWDSVAQLSIMMAIESKFGCRPPIEKMAELASIPALVEFIEGSG